MNADERGNSIKGVNILVKELNTTNQSIINFGKNALITLAVFLTIFAANSLWYGVVMRGYYATVTGSWVQVTRENPSVPVILAGMFVLAVLMVLAYPKVNGGRKRPLLSNFLFGLVIGLIYVFPSSLYYLGTVDFLEVGPVAMDVGWHMIEEGLAGIVLGILYAKF